MIKLPKPWRKLHRHQLSGEYHDIAGTQWERFVENIKSNGIVGKRAITLCDGQVLDGWQLYRACLEANVKPKFQELPKSITAEAFVETMNDLRRHESTDEANNRIAARRERVLAGRATGKSIRAMAAEEQVSKSQIERDLAAASGVPSGTPDLQDVQAETQIRDAESSKTGTVTGLDGKTYPATKTAVETLADASDAEPEADPTPEELMAAHNANLEAWCRDLMKFAKTMPDDPWLQDMNKREGALLKLRGVCSTIRSAKCSFICHKCDGLGCKTCHQTGRLTKFAKESL